MGSNLREVISDQEIQKQFKRTIRTIPISRRQSGTRSEVVALIVDSVE